MRKLLIVPLKCLLVLTFYVASLSFAIADKPKTPTWAKTEPYGHEQKTILHFYFHEIGSESDKDPSLVLIAQPQEPNPSKPFGELYMADDPLTSGPEINSTLIGNAQGLYGVASKGVVSLIMGLTYNFVDGIYNGSSISVLGRNTIMKPGLRELPVVGGTGLFRMARGYILANTLLWNKTTGIVIVEYNVTIFHPKISINNNIELF